MKKSESYEYNIHQMNEFVFNIDNVKFTQILDILPEPAPLRSSASGVMHFHHYYEVFYVTEDSDELFLEFENEIKFLKTGDLICISPFVHHLLGSNKNFSTKILVLNFIYEKNTLQTDNNFYQNISQLFSAPYLYLSDCNGLNRIFSELTRKPASDIANNILYHSSIFFNLMLELMTLTDEKAKSSQISRKPSVLDSNSRRLITIDNIINTHYHSNITMQEIADMLHLSAKQIGRIILKEYGCTFYQLMIQARMRKAAQLLRTTDLSVSAISQQVGYSSTSNFYNVFKKTYQVMPLEYRKSNRLQK